MAIIRNFRLPVGVGISADYIETFGVIQSTTPGTGAIVSRGGVGIGDSVSIAGRLQLFSGSNYTAFQSSASGNTVYILPSTTPAIGSSILQSDSVGNMSWIPFVPNYSITAGTATTATYSHQSGYAITSGTAATAINLNTVAASTNTNHYIMFSPSNGGSGVAVSSDAGLLFNPASNTITTNTFSAGVSINTVTASVTGSTASTSSSTGALVVTGGAAIGQSLNTSSSYASSVSGVVSNNGVITTGSWAGSTITGNYGGTGHTTYTKGDLIVGAGSTFIKQSVGTDGSILVANSNAGSGISWRGPLFGNFTSYTTQPVTAADTATPLTLSDGDSSAGISIMGGAGVSSRIQISEAGFYNIQFSAQLNQSTGSTPQVASIWVKKNGTDIPGSLGVITVSGHNNYTVASWNYIESFTAGQYFEFYFSSPDNHMQVESLTGLTLPTRPDSPSFAVTVIKVL